MLKNYCMNCNFDWTPDGNPLDNLCPQCFLFASNQYDDDDDEPKLIKLANLTLHDQTQKVKK